MAFRSFSDNQNLTVIGTNDGWETLLQLALPALVQLIATSIHVLDIDLYNRQSVTAAVDRTRRVWRVLCSAIPVRMLRIIPAFSMGSVVNAESLETDHSELGI